MTIKSEISTLEGYVQQAYRGVSYKGGTLPADKNTKNLYNAIYSIKTPVTGDGTPWGSLIICATASTASADWTFLPLSSFEEMQATLCTSWTTKTINGTSVNINNIRGYCFGDYVTHVPNDFGRYTPNMNMLWWTEVVREIGDNFFYGRSGLTWFACSSGHWYTNTSSFQDTPTSNYLYWSNVTKIGNNFMQNCTGYQGHLTTLFDGYSDAVTQRVVGDNCFYGCTQAGAKDTGNIFIKGKSIGSYFMYNCQKWATGNTTTSYPSIYIYPTTIGNYFLSNAAKGWNTPNRKTFSLGNSGGSEPNVVGSHFMDGFGSTTDYSVGEQLILYGDYNSIGDYFCYNFNGLGMLMFGSGTTLDPAVIASSNYTFSTSSTTAHCYKNGIMLSISDSTKRNAMYTRFPNRTSSPYRYLK